MFPFQVFREFQPTLVGGFKNLGQVIRSLFANNEQGVWYDPSDLSTLFQDSAGTTPVTAVEQPVGLMLDKSKGLVLGPELVTNGTFDTADGWTLGTGWSIANGVASYSGSLGSNRMAQAWAGQNGKTYKVTLTFTMKNTPSHTAAVIFQLGGTGQNVFVESQRSLQNGQTYTLTGYGTPTTVSAFEFQVRSNLNHQMDFDVDNISVRELPGNHASQPTATSRPVLSARYNLLTKTEQFDDAAWTKTNATVTPNAAVAPNGAMDADKLVEDTSTTLKMLRGTLRAVAQNQPFTTSCCVKADGRDYVLFGFWERTNVYGLAKFNIADGSFTGDRTSPNTEFISATSEYLGDGWYKLITTWRHGFTGAVPYLIFGNSDLTPGYPTIGGSYTGDGTSGIYIWGASLVHANQASLPYQRVNTDTDYDTVGFPHYLRFDGVDDWMVTNTITPGIDKVQVFVGVQRLRHSAETEVIAEAGSTSSYPGAFYLVAQATDTRYGYSGRGNRGGIVNDQVSLNLFPAPDTAVLTATQDINGNTPSRMRRNAGAWSYSINTDFGGGNFLDYPLYIGRRAGTTFPFAGHLYNLIVRFGSNLPDATIEMVEKYVNRKTRAY